MAISAADVKKLRDETDAPMMECKAALEESGGDFNKARDILREKGKAAAVKRAGRSTSAGRVALCLSSDKKQAGGVILECETDFVATNDMFAALAQKLADHFATNEVPGDVTTAVVDGKTIAQHIEEAIAVIRENIQLTKAMHVSGSNLSTYVHHDFTKGAIVGHTGDSAQATEAARKVAIQSVAFPSAVFANKSDIPADTLEKEFETQVKRAMEEGKPGDIAEKIAKGRLDKEYVNQVALTEMAYYADGSKTVKQFLQEEGKAAGEEINILSFIRLQVGQED